MKTARQLLVLAARLVMIVFAYNFGVAFREDSTHNLVRYGITLLVVFAFIVDLQLQNAAHD